MLRQNRVRKSKRKRKGIVGWKYDKRHIYRDDGELLDKRIPVYRRIKPEECVPDYRLREVCSCKN